MTYKDINGVEITNGCKVMCYPANEVRMIYSPSKPWVKGLSVHSKCGEWGLNKTRALKMEVI